MNIAWVLGSGGLLGTALCRTLRRNGTELFFPAERFCWDRPHQLVFQITAAVQAFAIQIRTSDRWEIYWAAGVGTMSCSADVLASETRTLSLLLQLVKSNPHLMAVPGALTFASSAGAIYAGSSDDIITENTIPMPTTAYAHEKLKQEDLVRTFAVVNRRTSALIARISTLYGPGQADGKKQGLLTHITRRILRNQPIHIYVPYNTIRDYIGADDAAEEMVFTLRAISEKPRILIKIIASEQPMTIAMIISIFKRITRNAPRIVTSVSPLSALYSRRVHFRSIVLPICARTPKNSLVVGIAQLIMAERAAYVRCQSAGEG
jgi:UDP-glucose 4-epimerase